MVAHKITAGQATKTSQRRSEMNCEYVCNYYKVPACIGRRVVVYGKPGIIYEDRGSYIGVNFDSDKPGMISNAHPTDGVEYGEMGTLRKMTPSQKRYRDYIKSETSLKFSEYLGIVD